MAADIDTSSIEADAIPRKRLNPRIVVALIIAVVVIVVALVAWLIHYQTRGRFFESTNDAFVRADTVIISPRVGGYVERVFVADDQDVKAGQPLVQIDPRDYRAQTSQYSAQIDVAGASADNLVAGIGEQEAAVDQARAQLATSQAEAQFATGEVARYAPLAASGAETREKLASLRTQAAQALNNVAAQRAALLAAERRIASLRAQVRQAQAQRKATQAQFAAANVNLGSTIVRASIDGRIGDKSVRVGQFVQPGLRLMSLVPLGALYVIANFKETQVGLMRRGQHATIEVDALPGVTLDGHVESLSPGTGAQFSLLPPQNATGNFTKIVQRVPVRVTIDTGPQARRLLVPGMSVEVTVDTISAKGDIARVEQQEDARRKNKR